MLMFNMLAASTAAVPGGSLMGTIDDLARPCNWGDGWAMYCAPYDWETESGYGYANKGNGDIGVGGSYWGSTSGSAQVGSWMYAGVSGSFTVQFDFVLDAAKVSQGHGNYASASVWGVACTSKQCKYVNLYSHSTRSGDGYDSKTDEFLTGTTAPFVLESDDWISAYFYVYASSSDSATASVHGYAEHIIIERV